MVFNPPADYVVQLEDILLVMGHAEDIETFRRRYVL
jgi:Trk K+ transport system NAD-binding subunit